MDFVHSLTVRLGLTAAPTVGYHGGGNGYEWREKQWAGMTQQNADNTHDNAKNHNHRSPGASGVGPWRFARAHVSIVAGAVSDT